MLRELRPDEAEALRAFYNGLPEERRRLFRPLGWEASREAAAAVCAATARGERCDLVLEAGGDIVGWAFVTRLGGGTAHLGIALAAEAEGQGFGRRMMDALIARCRERGLVAVELCHVVDNARARRLYEACGFGQTGTFVGKDGLAYAQMRLTLRP